MDIIQSYFLSFSKKHFLAFLGLFCMVTSKMHTFVVCHYSVMAKELHYKTSYLICEFFSALTNVIGEKLFRSWRLRTQLQA